MSSDPNCIFCKIAAGQIPSRKVYEDDELFGFHDIAPWAPVHFMLVPKRHIPSMAQVTPEDSALLGRIMTLAPKLALEQGCRPYPQGGFRIVVNTGAEPSFMPSLKPLTAPPRSEPMLRSFLVPKIITTTSSTISQCQMESEPMDYS